VTADTAPDADGLDLPAPRAVAFDIGEVLINETRVWATWAELVGVSPLTFAAVLGAAISQGADHVEAFAHVAPNVEWAALADEHERRLGGLAAADLYPDGPACLRALVDAGVTVLIAGNQPASRTPQLAALDLPHHVLVTSDELGVAKPDPAFFGALVARSGVADPAELLYVGDRVDNDVLPAIDAGVRICWLRRGPWGLLQALPDDVEPDLSLDGLGELPTLLEEWRNT
jgi:FMN phosphatase YigB (HAD superfamily)